MPKLYKILILLILTSCIPAKDSKKSIGQKQNLKPNIILIMTDDQGWFDVGFNGNDEIKTPNLDALAAKGIILDRFYAASAVCSPTRASLITGRNPLRMDIPYANNGHMKTEEITIPELLKKEGYTTGHFGKWHLGTLSKTVLDANRGGKPQFEKDYSIPSQHGYDQFFCTESKVPTFDPLIQPANFKEGESLRYGWRAVEENEASKAYGTAFWNKEKESETNNLEGDDSRVIMDRVIPFIENADKPFFSTLWFHTPHLPVVSDKTHRNIYKKLDIEKQLYYGTITAMDEQMGRLWNKLEELGVAENTIIFFCSDNGPERDTPGSAGIFRERKRSLYEGGVRVPAFVVWKGNFSSGQRIDFPMSTSDYLPTIVDLLAIKYPDTRPIDGISILDALEGKERQRTKPMGFICTPQISWVTQQYKLITDEKLTKFELYDLFSDKSEKHNVISDFPEVAANMKTDLLLWLKSVERSSEGLDYNN
ncbi:Arylsulfatase A [Spirosomataceae bacterium TFI 002]|nr:Arylsulfatase A [Spirosomataceae bacterium TFI 002]